jgi:hypothetical protein
MMADFSGVKCSPYVLLVLCTYFEQVDSTYVYLVVSLRLEHVPALSKQRRHLCAKVPPSVNMSNTVSLHTRVPVSATR